MNLISLLESSITSTIPSESSPTLPWQCYFLLLLHPSSRWRFKLSCLENAFMHLPHENFSVLVWTPLMWRLRSLASAAVNWQDGQSHRYGRVCNFWCFVNLYSWLNDLWHWLQVYGGSWLVLDGEGVWSEMLLEYRTGVWNEGNDWKEFGPWLLAWYAFEEVNEVCVEYEIGVCVVEQEVSS
jgi:hypothetical protein